MGSELLIVKEIAVLVAVIEAACSNLQSRSTLLKSLDRDLSK